MATPHLGERSPGITELLVRSRPGVAQYRFEAANTVDQAFTGTTTMFTVPRDGMFRSPSLQRSSLSRVDGNYRGTTRAQINFDDYAAATIHGDAAINFVRVTELDSTGAVMNTGPLMVVPPADFFTTPMRTISLTGTAPNPTSSGTGLPPEGALVISFPRAVDAISIYNDDPANSLFVSLGDGMPEVEVPVASPVANSRYDILAGSSTIYLHGNGSQVPFRLTATVVSGLR